MVCAADDDLYAWVMGWFAQIIQEPSTKIGTAVAFRGPPGSGKTIVGEMIGSLFVKNYMLVDNPSLVAGRFNGHLANLLLLHCDESFFAGDKATAGRLRTIITAPVIPVEFKGREPISMKSCVRVLVTSEHGWIVPASVGERRFAVLDVSSARIGDYAYFRALAGTDRAALLHHLLNIDLEDVNLRRIPQTAGLIDQKIETAGALTKFWRDCLDRGHVLDTEKGWPEKVETDRLYEAYIAYAKDMGERYRRSAESFGKELKTMCPAAEKRRLREGGDRRYFYTLPGLEEARAAMAKYIGCP